MKQQNSLYSKQVTHFVSTMPVLFFWLAGMAGIGYFTMKALGLDASGWNIAALDLWIMGMAWQLVVCKGYSAKKVIKGLQWRLNLLVHGGLRYSAYDMLSKESEERNRNLPSCPIR